MGFDAQNFGIGLVAGWVSAYVVYRFRRQISFAATSARSQASNVQNYATRSADGRYIKDLIDLAQKSHLAGHYARLTDLLVEPRFIPPQELAGPPNDEVIPSVFNIVPQVPDHPYLHAVYNLETLSIDDLATGDRALALLGLPGSGRTTALLTIALHSLGQVRFQQLEDLVQRNLDAEEAALTDKERAERVKARERIAQLAREELSEKGVSFDVDDRGDEVASFNRMFPIYVHMANVNVSPDEFGSEIDPAEPLVRAVQSQVGPITARSLPSNMYRRLNQGYALLLIDGLDDLPLAERKEKTAWLRALVDQYRDNFIIVAGTPTGYAPLAQMGLTPIHLRPWNDLDIRMLVQRWSSTWPMIGGTRRRPANRPDEATLSRARTNNRALPPADLTFKVWAALADDTEIPGTQGWLTAYLARHLPARESMETLLPQLARIAALQLDEGFITLAQVENLVNSEQIAGIEDEEQADSSVKGRGKKKEEGSAQSRFLNMLRRSGLLVEYRGGRLQFRHHFVAAYLASLTVASMDQATLLERAETSSWSQAIAYSAMHSNIDAVVQTRLALPPDVLYKQVLDTAHWLTYAAPDVSWRGPLLKQLGNILVAPSQYPLLRERAAAALIGTRDKGVLFVFRQAARNPSPDVRMLACLGMGAVGNPEAARDLIPLLEDQVNQVQLAAAMALGAVGSQDGLQAMVISLTEGDELLRMAVAESLALVPEEGHPVLLDAITHPDMMVRRAASFGLRRVGSHWAVDALYRAFIEDDQWYVKSAAQQAFFDLQNREDRGPRRYPSIETVQWVNEWAQQQGEKVPSGEAAYQILIQALQAGEPATREMAARIIGQLGAASMAKTLYNTLRDRQAEVRSAAYRSLADLEMQIDELFPAPN